MSMNWLEGVHRDRDGPGMVQAMPVFAGQKLVVVGGSSGMGRHAAADVVAAWRQRRDYRRGRRQGR
jgi:hypothetical protein